MPNYITPVYVFTPGKSGEGKINLSGISNFDIRKLIKITNQSCGIIIYQNNDAGLRYTAITATTLTLLADTSTMNSTDILQILYET